MNTYSNNNIDTDKKRYDIIINVDVLCELKKKNLEYLEENLLDRI